MLCYRKSKRLIDIFDGTLSFISHNRLLRIVFSLYLQHNKDSKWMDSKKSFIYREKYWLNHFIYHKLERTGCFRMTSFGTYQVIHYWCEQNKLFKGPLSYICGNEYFKYVIDGKVYMNLSVKAREKNYFKAKNFAPFLSLNCVKISVWVPFCYKLSLLRIRRVRNLTIYDFRQVHLESVKNVMLSHVKNVWSTFVNRTLSIISLNKLLKIDFCGTCSIIMIRSEWINRKISFTEKNIG